MITKVFAATTATQGRRKNDFIFATPGELVMPAVQCDRDKRSGPDGGCGCRRSWGGMLSMKGTTTIQVVERRINFHSLALRVQNSMKRAGFDVPSEVSSRVASDLFAAAEKFPTGTVLEIRGNTLVVRKVGGVINRKRS